MENEKNGKKIEEEYLPGQLKLGLPEFEKYPRTKRHRPAGTPVVDDPSFLLDHPGEEDEEEKYEGEFSLGTDW